MTSIGYVPRRAGFEVLLESERGWLTAAAVGLAEPCELAGDPDMLDNLALVGSVVSYGTNELAYRRSRSPEKRKSHQTAVAKYGKEAVAIAGLMERVGGRTVSGWCSGCFELNTHQHVRGHQRPRAKYLCRSHRARPRDAWWWLDRCRRPGHGRRYCGGHGDRIERLRSGTGPAVLLASGTTRGPSWRTANEGGGLVRALRHSGAQEYVAARSGGSLGERFPHDQDAEVEGSSHRAVLGLSATALIGLTTLVGPLFGSPGYPSTVLGDLPFTVTAPLDAVVCQLLP